MRRVLLSVLTLFVVIALIVGFVMYRKLVHPSFEAYAPLVIIPSTQQNTSLRAMFMGVTTILLDDGETAIMTDGFFSRPRPSDMLKIEPNNARITYALNKAGIRQLAAVLTVHSHHDHAMDSPVVARQTDALLIGSESTGNIARGLKFPMDRFKPISGDETFIFGRFKITVIKSPHVPDGYFMGEIATPLQPQEAVWDYKEGGNYSFLIEHDAIRILIYPSANFTPGLLKKKDVKCDIIFLGIGRLGKQDNSQQFSKDYWQEVVRTTGAKTVIPIHWDDFMIPLDEPLKPLPSLFDDFEGGINPILRLAEEDRITVRFMSAFASVNISDLMR